MAFRETYNSAPLLLDTDLDEFVGEVKAVWGQQDNVAPSGVSVCGFVEVESTSDGSYRKHFIYRFDGTTGDFIDRTNAFSFVFGILVRRISEHEGMLLWWRDLGVFTMDPDTFALIDSSNTLWPKTNHWNGANSNEEHYGWSPREDIYFAQTQEAGANRIKTYVATTGADRNIEIAIPGSVDPPGFQGAHVQVTRPPYGMCVIIRGVMCFFNYVTGQILNLSRMPTWDAAAGELPGERVYGYDRYNDRLLVLDHPDETGSPPQFPGFIRGFDPTPQAFTLQQPIATLEPRVDGVTKIFTRAIGSGGEGIGNLSVTFSDDAVGDVAPVVVVTDRTGYAEALYDGLAVGGAETIVVTAETPPDLVTPSTQQGSGGSIALWSPELHLDFRDQVNLADVSALITEQADWDKGTAYGTQAATVVARVGRVSSARLTIQSGTAGTPTSGANGTFGGDLVVDATDQVAEGSELWAGVWVFLPAGYDITASGDGLLILRIGNDSTANYMSVRLSHTGGAHTGWSLEWPDETVTDTRHVFEAQAAGQIQDDTWTFVQYHCLAHSVGASTTQRLWMGDQLVWELVDDAAQHLITGFSTLQSFTANESIPTLGAAVDVLDELKVFNDWEGNAPSDQTLYVGNVVWTLDTDDLLPEDSLGNQYISPTAAEAL